MKIFLFTFLLPFFQNNFYQIEWKFPIQNKNIITFYPHSDYYAWGHKKELKIIQEQLAEKFPHVANKVFYYLAGYRHSLSNKNASHIWDNSRWTQSATRSELANLILNFKNRVQGRNLNYQDLINRWIWNGSNPHSNVTGVEFTTMIARATAL